VRFYVRIISNPTYFSTCSGPCARTSTCTFFTYDATCSDPLARSCTIMLAKLIWHLVSHCVTASSFTTSSMLDVYVLRSHPILTMSTITSSEPFDMVIVHLANGISNLMYVRVMSVIVTLS